MLLKFLLDQRDFLMLHTLLQYHVLNENVELAQTLVTLGSIEMQAKQAENIDQIIVSVYYEPAF